MAITIQELVTALGFKIDENALKQYNKSIDKTVTQTINKTAKIGLALGGALIGLSAKTFGEFEASLNELTAVSGATTNQIAILEKQALGLGKSTRFSAQQVAQGQIALARAGLTTKQILEATAGTTALAAANNLTLADSADITASTMGGFGLAADQVNRIADVLTKTVSSSNQQMSDLKESMKFAAPQARAAGQSFENTAALLGILANNGLRGTVAATGLNQILARVANPKFRKEFEDLGVAVEDKTTGGFRNLIDILRDTEAKTRDLNKVESFAIKQRLFGLIGVKSANAIMATSIENQDKLFKATNNASGSAQSMANIMNKGLIPEFLRFKAAVEGAAIEMGKRFAPVIQKLLIGAQKFLNTFSELSPTTLDVIANLVLLGTAVSGVVFAFTSWKLAAATLSPILMKMFGAGGVGTMITGAGLAAAAAWVGLAGIFALTIDDIITGLNGGETAIEAFLKKFPKIKQIVDFTFDGIVKNLNELVNDWKNNFDAIVKNLNNWVNDWKNIFDIEMPLIFTRFKNNLTDMRNNIATEMGLSIENMQPLANWFQNELPGIIDGFVNYLKGVWEDVKNIFAGVGDFITSGLSKLNTLIGGDRQLNFSGGTGGNIPAGTLTNGNNINNTNQASNQNNNINSPITVNVNNSNASAGDIARQTAGAVTGSWQDQINSIRQNQPAIVR